MTDREKAIVMAYTGACMLTGDKFQIFHKYVEKIMGRSIWTHEMAQLADEIKEKSKDDFMKLCADENLNEWIPVSEKYEHHIDHTDCIWYGNDSGCPVTCSQYRDGWNDAMDYIFKNGDGYRPYRRNENG
jgi:hypothetical protein